MKKNLIPKNDIFSLFNLHKNLDDFFKDFDDFGNDVLKTSSTVKINFSENEKSYQVLADMPGVDKNDIFIDENDGNLTIAVERKGENKTEDKNYIHQEISYGKFERIVKLPNNIDKDNIKAKYKDGVLTITIPKKNVTEKTKNKITIE